jgi:hypothetical protein
VTVSSKWRDRLTGTHDEFSQRGTELTTEQREHLTRVTDELLKRYSISRSPGADGSPAEGGGEPVSASEIGGVLESVLVEAFDFGWFTRADLPEAPELSFDPTELEGEPAPDAEAGHVAESFTWPDPSAAADQAAESAASWGRALGPPIAAEPVPESELELELEPDLEPGMLSDAEIEIVELEELHRAAVDAERAAAIVAAATRERLVRARERWERTRA